MIVEALKFVLDTPEKLTRGILSSTRYLFALLLTLLLCGFFFGDVRNIKADELAIWKDWFLTGKVLLFIFLYLVSYVALFDLMPTFTCFPLTWASRKYALKPPLDKGFAIAIFRVLGFFQLVDFNKQTERIKATRNTEKVIAFLEEIATKDNEIDPMETSSYLEVWHFYVLFVFYYFCTWHLFRHGTALTLIVLVFIVTIPAVYLYFKLLFNFLRDHADDILFAIKGVDIDAKLEYALSRQHCPVVEKVTPDGKGYWRVFQHKNQEYYLLFSYVRGSLTESIFGEFVLPKLTAGVNVALFTNASLGPSLQEKSQSFGQKLVLIFFSSSDDFPVLLQAQFPDERPLHVNI